jgi:hypothetical protein
MVPLTSGVDCQPDTVGFSCVKVSFNIVLDSNDIYHRTLKGSEMI